MLRRLASRGFEIASLQFLKAESRRSGVWDIKLVAQRYPSLPSIFHSMMDFLTAILQPDDAHVCFHRLFSVDHHERGAKGRRRISILLRFEY